MVFAFVPLHHLFPCASPSCIHLGRRLPSSLRIPQPARLALRNSAGLQIWQNHTGRRGYPKGAPSRITSESLSQLAKDLSFSFGQQSWHRWTQTDRVKQQFQGQALWKSRTCQQFYGPKKWQRSSQQWQDSWAWDGWVSRLKMVGCCKRQAPWWV